MVLVGEKGGGAVDVVTLQMLCMQNADAAEKVVENALVAGAGAVCMQMLRVVDVFCCCNCLCCFADAACVVHVLLFAV